MKFDATKFPQLKVAHPRLWWPALVGRQEPYSADLEFEADGRVSDRQTIAFGIREVRSILDGNGHRLFQINGQNILIRGAGYTFDMLLRSSPERRQAELDYVRHMHLNAVRLRERSRTPLPGPVRSHGHPRHGGWCCCCDQWEHWRDWTSENHAVSAASLRDQIRRLRSHLAVFDWLNGSDNPPPPEVEGCYISILKECDWPNKYQSSATEKTTPVAGKTG